MASSFARRHFKAVVQEKLRGAQRFLTMESWLPPLPVQPVLKELKLNCFQQNIQQTVQHETYLIILQKIFTFPHFL